MPKSSLDSIIGEVIRGRESTQADAQRDWSADEPRAAERTKPSPESQKVLNQLKQLQTSKALSELPLPQGLVCHQPDVTHMTKGKYPKRSSKAFARSKAVQDVREETVRLALAALNAAHERREKEKSERAK